MRLDNIISKIAALGVPGLVLLFVAAVSGFSGAASITAALSTLGGPIGMLGGIGLLILLALIVQALTEFGFETLFRGVINKIKKERKLTNREIKKIIDGYWFLSDGLKKKLKEYVDMWGNGIDPGGAAPTPVRK